MDPYLNGLIRGLEERFPNLEVFGSFSALGPQAATSPDHEAAHGHLRTLAEHFPSVDASIAVEEWMSFREHVVSGALKVSHQVLFLLGLFFQLGSTNMKPHVVILCLAL